LKYRRVKALAVVIRKRTSKKKEVGVKKGVSVKKEIR
jgi:hypothetical protein